MRVQWDFAVTLPALGIQGVTAQPTLLLQGSHADIYEHPSDPTKLIKITDDQDDATNTMNAQALHSPNVVRCYGHTNAGVQNGTALVLDFIQGQRAPYSTPEFLGLIEGQHGNEPRDQAHIRILRPDAFRTSILQTHGTNNQQELHALSRLFRTIDLLDSRLNIHLVDLADNIIDDGHDYVIVDFGR